VLAFCAQVRMLLAEEEEVLTRRSYIEAALQGRRKAYIALFGFASRQLSGKHGNSEMPGHDSSGSAKEWRPAVY